MLMHTPKISEPIAQGYLNVVNFAACYEKISCSVSQAGVCGK